MEGVSDIKVEIKEENESDDEVESGDLFSDHVIKEEMVIGPVVLQAVDVTYCPKDVPVSKKPKLETKDEETDQVKPESVKKEDNTEGIISNVVLFVEKNWPSNIKTNTAHNHTGQATFCEYRTNVKSHLHNHTREKPYSCSYCDYKCNEKNRLSKHMLRHTGEKPYSCTFCQFRTHVKRNLTRHLRIHTDEKPFSCSQCEYKCHEKCSLLRHMFRHSGEKPYSCSACEYKTNQKSNLSIHSKAHLRTNRLRIHTDDNEKQHSCSQCEYKCVSKSNLKQHLRIHTGEKPYSCSKCEYTAKRKSNLSSHSKTHLREK